MLLILFRGRDKNVFNEQLESSFTAPTIPTNRERKEPSLLHYYPMEAHTSDRIPAVNLRKLRYFLSILGAVNSSRDSG